jgi:hypothetical protein
MVNLPQSSCPAVTHACVSVYIVCMLYIVSNFYPHKKLADTPNSPILTKFRLRSQKADAESMNVSEEKRCKLATAQ